ncbi:MAG: carbohydrate kinase [Chitinivibrionales bacterium]|nr:carbohydrate kinase [Chitinivibrionales bacterium]
MYLLGYDIGSSSIKATLLDAETGTVVGSAISPEKELEIIAAQPGWAEQHPETWWEHVKKATAGIKNASGADLSAVSAIGISYQMHGLVAVDSNGTPLRPSIIWCDSRAVPYGEKAFETLGTRRCLEHLLNSPGNFTASKLAWVKENEPEIFGRIHKIMLPGDYIAMKLTGKITTTPSGLSEGIMWDFTSGGPAKFLLEHFGFTPDILPEVVPTFSSQGELSADAAAELGIKPGTVVAYRGGDQPNNALSLNVLNPGEVATTAGTSGVVYGVGDKPEYDPLSRVNTFVHVNYSRENPRYGILLCLNGTGILNSWAKHNCMSNGSDEMSYKEMDKLASQAPVGSGGLMILPYGNGAERTLGNRNINASIHNLDFNRHTSKHLLRAVQEGIVFALNYGLEIMREIGVDVKTVRAGNANMFLSPVFSDVFATVTRAGVELYDTDGAQGAARGAGIGAGIYPGPKDAFSGLKAIKSVDPDETNIQAYADAYGAWAEMLKKYIH